MIKEENLDFWIKHNQNVLFVGKHGVGKTSIVKDAFRRNKLNWKYYSASTMDPWVDLVGVPKECKNANGDSFLDLIRPREFQEDKIEALFFDEFNRSHKKVRNAVMELIQFKSINGKKFEHLRVVWAAINPDDDEDNEYDVEKLDPAQEDRFQIKVELPYELHKPFFVQKYGLQMANAAADWWNALPSEQKKLVSPRRMDDALNIYQKQGDLRFVLPKSTNVSKLIQTIQVGPASIVLKKLFEKKNLNEAKKFLSNENNYIASIGIILASLEYRNFFLQVLDSEKLSQLIADKGKPAQEAFETVMSQLTNDYFAQLIEDILTASTNNKLTNKIKNYMRNKGLQIVNGKLKTPSKRLTKNVLKFNSQVDDGIVSSIIVSSDLHTSAGRMNFYKKIVKNLPEYMTSTALVINLMSHLLMIMEDSRLSTLYRMDAMPELLNYCINRICDIQNKSWKQLCNIHNSSYCDYAERIRAINKKYPGYLKPSEEDSLPTRKYASKQVIYDGTRPVKKHAARLPMKKATRHKF